MTEKGLGFGVGVDFNGKKLSLSGPHLCPLGSGSEFSVALSLGRRGVTHTGRGQRQGNRG